MPNEAANWPEGQLVQPYAPSGEYEPLAQFVQPDAKEGAYVPAPHGEHKFEPEAE
jgi:hypothetical protein